MRFPKTQVGLLVALLIGNAIVLYSSLQWGWLRFPTALGLIFVLPGWAWLPALDWMQTRRALERLVLVIGLSSLLSAMVLFLALLLPGPFTETPALVALNLATLTGLLYQLIPHPPFQTPTSTLLHDRNPHPKSKIQNPKPETRNPKSKIQNPKSKIRNPKSEIEWPARHVLLILLAILAFAAVTRLTRIGYAEFHEDELENMRLIVRVYKGEEYASFLDSKGPIHWLHPAALWYLNGWLNEGIARTPFAMTALLLVPMVYVLGRRMSGGRDSIGLLAAGFVAINGFFVAYARQVENQSLIVFWGALAMWFAYRYHKEGIGHFLLWIALALAIGLIAHPDVLLYLPVFAYIIGLKLWFGHSAWRQQWPWLIGAGIFFAGLVGLFYVPYLTGPDIGLVYQYFGQDRVGTSLLYNRVANVFDQDRLYATRYHAPVLVVLLFWLLARNFARWRRYGWGILGGVTLAMISAVTHPEVWIVANLNLAFVPYALLTLLVTLLPRTDFETKTLFLWFSAPMWLLIFFAKDAADHIQVAYTAWALLSAFALADVWALLSDPTGRPSPLSLPVGIAPGRVSPFKIPTRFGLALRSIIILILTLGVILILFYQYLAFDSPVTTYWRAKIDSASNPNSLYNRVYGSIPRPRKIFSNPRLGGWKVASYLWETGVLSGDFRSINESFAVPIWYTFQTPRSCYNDPQNYWLRRGWRGWPEAEEQEVVERGYTLTRVILVDQQPKLHLYEKNVPPREPEILDLEDYRRRFDRLATPARFAQDGVISQITSLTFDDKLLMRGYDLLQKTVRPGDLLPVTVYWEALAPMDIRYRGFMHLVGVDGARRGQHDDDPACRLLTTDMRPGQRSSRQFRLPVDPATPAGEYNVVFGLYDPATLERLEIWDNLAGQSPGSSIVLGQVKVE